MGDQVVPMHGLVMWPYHAYIVNAKERIYDVREKRVLEKCDPRASAVEVSALILTPACLYPYCCLKVSKYPIGKVFHLRFDLHLELDLDQR